MRVVISPAQIAAMTEFQCWFCGDGIDQDFEAVMIGS